MKITPKYDELWTSAATSQLKPPNSKNNCTPGILPFLKKTIDPPQKRKKRKKKLNSRYHYCHRCDNTSTDNKSGQHIKHTDYAVDNIHADTTTSTIMKHKSTHTQIDVEKKKTDQRVTLPQLAPVKVDRTQGDSNNKTDDEVKDKDNRVIKQKTNATKQNKTDATRVLALPVLRPTKPYSYLNVSSYSYSYYD